MVNEYKEGCKVYFVSAIDAYRLRYDEALINGALPVAREVVEFVIQAG